MLHTMQLLLLATIVSMVRSSPYTSYQNQRFAMEPQDQTAVVGARVTLPCRVINKQGTLQWTKDDFGLGTSRDLSGFERYAMVGSDEEGDYSLDIYPVMLDDDARYQCQVSPGPEGQPAIRSTFAGLTVLVPPEAPKITQGDVIYATEDRKVEIECVSVGGKPAAEITWIDGLGNVLTDNIEYTVIPLPDQRRFTAKSVLRLTPKKEHHNTNFSCQAQNTADRTYRSAKIRVEVKYAPKVKVNVMGSLPGGAGGSVGGAGGSVHMGTGSRIVEHSQVRLECRADANPSDVRYRWFINDEPIIGGQKTEMVIRNVTRKFHDAIVKCEVQNSVGKSEDSETLDISYAPSFRQRPQSMEADVGSVVSLTCEVDSNPQPEVVWIQHPSDRVVGTSTNLTFSVSNETAGRYYCKANVPGYAEISADAYVYLKGSPAIGSQRTQYGLVGDTARIECFASSVPRARHVSWTFNGQEISSESGHDYSILVDAVPGGVKSTLIIRDSQAYHYGKYNCTVVNDYGNDVAEIQLQAKKSVSLLMTIVGGISVVAFLLVLTILVVVYIKCKKRTKLPPADVISEHQITKNGGVSCKLEPGDRTSNYSDLKVDISGGYVPYGDYSTHYSPPPQYLTTCSTKSNGSSTILQNNHQNQLQLQQQQQQSHHQHHPQTTTLPMTFLTNSSGGSLTGSIIGSREIRQDNGLPSLQSTTASVVSSSPNGSCSNQSTTAATTTTTHVVVPSSMALSVDPRYSAIYGNPYLRSSNSSLLPPPTAV
ncbi:irregular chiasm C-roughest protein isoform X1 [Drosophila santomea]|uniref:irregular chiasm C-roughest protein isoform X1 n=2 Tax=Drosophila santomea TaxID=129105 RepID=UPI001953B87C|nr:irregular chiasm C-roughest protein isoform X1 [Drosophila santomea]XP_039499337.1 irregular chiasm C-roughest protein isoform X1 [Drosophila santomea]XP_039499338.1 irregular chiasm C-roughest protein isoform X1 [Drosophila santomea]